MTLKTIVLSIFLASPLAAQTAWETPPPPSPTPPARLWHTFDYDFVRREALVFGGAAQVGAPVLGDTWVWNGSSWAQKSPANPPSPRFGHVMALDGTVPGRSMVMFGGKSAIVTNILLDETWTWDGSAWQFFNLAVRPAGRVDAAMGWDMSSQTVLMHGGRDINGNTLDDTWRWNGTTWTSLGSSGFPREGHRMSFAVSSQGQGLHIFGGSDGANLTNGLLFFDGAGWSPDNTLVTRPPARKYFGLAFDYFRGRLVVAGGQGASGILSDTWELVGNQWVQRAPSPSLPLSAMFDMDFVDSELRTVAFGGINQVAAATNVRRTYGPSVFGSYVTSGTGCPGSQMTVPTIAAAPSATFNAAQPWLGETLIVSISGLLPSTGNIVLYFAPAALTPPGDLAVVGAPGCFLYVNPAGALLLPLPAADGSGRTTWTLPIPNDPSLLGAPLHNQVFQWDAGANPFGAAFSNYGLGTIGGL